MAWFGEPDPTTELDAKIEEASSEALPNGELDIAVGLEITDMIRSKNVPPQLAMRSLKKRLTKVYNNPNLLTSTLKLIDLCVKNCGGHFIAEINSKEFVDYLVDFIFKVHYDVKTYQVYSSEAKYSVGNQILKLIKEWSLYFQNQESKYLDKLYNILVRQGYEFPDVDPLIAQGASNFIDSEAPPDWIDGKDCMICYSPFSVMNRKHHCRACGGVFCQTHSSNSIPLVSLGIMQPVRVCDDCYQIHKSKTSDGRSGPAENGRSRERSSQPKPQDDEEEQIRKAIELSLKDTQVVLTIISPPISGPANDDGEELDEDLKAAIAASLQESQPNRYLQPVYDSNSQSQPLHYQPPEPELDFYLNIMPSFDVNAYSDAPQPSYQANAPTGYGVPVIQTRLAQPTGSSAQITPAQHIEQHKPRLEDLTPQEEEDINLFIQLMNGIKNDRSKQANILYDKDLGELHNKVMQLKPKLNRSLRNSIEKYEFFLDMNNKISTITRLYDLFLEAKLNQAYSKHYVSSPYGQYGQSTGNTYSSFDVAGSQQRSHAAEQYISSQASGPQYGKPQTTGPGANNTEYGGVHQQQTIQHTGQQPQSTGGQSGMPYPMEDTTSYQSYTAVVQQNYAPSNEPSAPGYGMGPSEPDFDDQAFEPEYPNQVPSGSNYANQSYNSGYYPTEPPLAYNSAGDQSFFPNFPSYPLNPDSQEQAQSPQRTSSSYPPAESEGVSDTESVASRYPPVAGFSDEEVENTQATKTHASMRYPEIDLLDGAENLPQMPKLKKLDTSDSKKYKSEPEPLIEL